MAETNALNDMVSLKPYPNVSAFLSGTKQAPTPKGYVGVAEIAPAQQELRQAQAKAREDIGKADINIEKAKREEQAAKMQVDVDVEKESAERIKEMPERMALKAKQEEASALKFMPTKDTAKDIAGLFSLIGIISMALGGNGRMSGQLALGNMNAMMEGYRKGRADLNKREAVEFDKNFKAMQAALETLSREYKDALEIEKSDKERGRLERHMALAKANSPVLKAMEEKLGPVNTNQTIDDLLKDLSNAATMKNNLQKHADDVQARKDAKLGKSQIFTGSDGNTYAYDPFTKKVTPVELPQGVTLSKVGKSSGTAPAGANVTDDLESSAQAIANYAQKPPGLRDKTRAQIMARVRQINPEYNEMDYGQRDLAMRNYTNPNGTGAKQLQAFTTVAGHLESLERLGEALNNKDTQLANKVLNYIAVQTGQPNVTNFNAAKQAVAGEVVKAITGTAGALADRKEAEQIFNEIQSPEQLQGAIDTVKELIYSRLDTARKHYESATGRHDFETRLPDIVKQTFIDKKRPTSSPSPQPQPTARPAETRQNFRTVEEAERANLPKGTKITINGRPATVE